MKIVATIEARMTSTRLPGKVLMEYQGKTNIEHIIDRIKRSKYVDDVVVATTMNEEDDPIVELCESIDCKFFRGSEDDVLLRVLDAAKSVDATHIVEITGDAPIVDWRIIDQAIELYKGNEYDYVCNFIKKTYPMGLEVQVFSVEVLNEVNKLTQSPVDHEHVSLYIYTNPQKYKIGNFEAPKELTYPNYQITLDTLDDYKLISSIYDALYIKNRDFNSYDVVQLLNKDHILRKLSEKTIRKDARKEQKEWNRVNGKI